MRYLTAWLVLLASSAVCAQEPRTVKVSAESEIEVAPDLVEIRLVVRTQNEKLIDAKRANDKIINNLVSLAETQEIPSKNFQVSNFDMEPEFTTRNLRALIPHTFDCQRTIVVKLTDFDRLETFLSDAFTAGVNYIDYIRYAVRDERPHLKEARKLAVAEAREKAQELVELTGMKLGAPVRIEERTSKSWDDWGYGGMGGAASMGGEAGASHTPQDQKSPKEGVKYVLFKDDLKKEAHHLFSPGTIKISLDVTIEFEMTK
jgi:uncharacterized protein YggE